VPDVSYSFYPVYCQLYDVKPKFIALGDSLDINPNDYQGAEAGVIFPNPNAPTGCLLHLHQIEQILQVNHDCVVVVDEAYIDFGGESAVKLIDHYPNLLITQTLSKSRSLAGMRIGLALGQKSLIEGLEKVKNSFNSYPLDRIAQAGAVAVFTDEAYFHQTCTQVIENRMWLEKQLIALQFKVLPSAANFVFASHINYKAELISQNLRSYGIIVRHFRQQRINNYLRISVGTMEQQQQLITVLQTFLT
jgi:histidinol-phosphate aminotransferase